MVPRVRFGERPTDPENRTARKPPPVPIGGQTGGGRVKLAETALLTEWRYEAASAGAEPPLALPGPV